MSPDVRQEDLAAENDRLRVRVAVLEAMEQRFRAVFEQAAVGIAEVGLDGAWTNVNDKLCAIVGYTRDELMTLTFQDITYAEDLDLDLAHVEQVLAGEINTYSMEKRYVRKDRSLVWVNLTVSLVRDSAGEPRHFISVVDDISARKRAEERFRIAAESLSDVIYEWDLGERIDWFGDIDGLMGYAPGEFPRTMADWGKTLHPDDRDRVMAAVASHLKGEAPYAQEYRLKRADGAYAWWTARGEAIRNADGKPLRWIGSITDITERKQADDALQAEIVERRKGELVLRESEERFNRLAEQSRTYTWAVDARGLYTQVCPRSEAILGYRPDEMVGRMHFYDLHPEPERAAFKEAAFAIFDRKEPFQNLESAVPTVTGKTVWISTSGIPLLDADGALSGYWGTDTDVTERKRMEEQKQALAEQLGKEQKLAAVGTLACGIGHEINNPIMGIINYAQLIKDRLQGKDGNVEEFAGEIVIEAERIAGIVRGLSAFASRDTATRAPVPVGDLIASALAPLREVLTHDQIALYVDLPDNLPAVVCDRGQIAQVLTSLLSNARDALNEKYPGGAPEKKIIVTASFMSAGMLEFGDAGIPNANDGPQGQMTNDADRRVRAIRLTVEDHGTGIPHDVREHILEPFFTTKDRSVGAGNIGKGLGLFVSHAYVQEHGGVLTVESESGQWTRFCIDLPAVPADVLQAQTLQADLPLDAERHAGEQWTGDHVDEMEGI